MSAGELPALPTAESDANSPGPLFRNVWRRSTPRRQKNASRVPPLRRGEGLRSCRVLCWLGEMRFFGAAKQNKSSAHCPARAVLTTCKAFQGCNNGFHCLLRRRSLRVPEHLALLYKNTLKFWY